MNFIYAINAQTETPVFLINTHIGFDEEDGQGICGETFAKEVFEISCSNPKLITFYVNCVGGSVKEGFDIFNSILSSTSKTKTVLNGFSYSTGGWCALSADDVEAYDYTTWMCHLPFNPIEESSETTLVNIVAKSIAKIISEKSGRNGKEKLTQDEVLAMMRSKTYYTAQELYDKGLINRIIASTGKIVRKTSSDFEFKNEYKKAQAILNKFVSENFNHKVMKFPKIINKLSLNENTSDEGVESAVLQHIEKVELANKELSDSNKGLSEKVNILNKEKEDLQARMAEMQNSSSSTMNKEKEDAMNEAKAAKDMVNKLTEDLKAAKDALKSAEEKINLVNKEKEEAEQKQKEDKATNLVNKFRGLGVIADSDEAAKPWIAQAIQNYEFTEAQLEAIPRSVKLPKPQDVQNILKEPAVGSFEAIKLRNKQEIAEKSQKK